MHVFRIWCVLCVLGFMTRSLCLNDVHYEGDYAYDYDNEIAQHQQEGESRTTPCQTADVSRWEKLFIALEDSHMRQNMLLESLEQCCGGTIPLRTQLEKLVRGTCQQCISSMESACRAQAEQARLRLEKGLIKLRAEEAERETRLNATLQMLLRSNHEANACLKQLEESQMVPSGAADSRMANQPTPRPGGSGAAFNLGTKWFPSGQKEQEVTSPLDMATIEKAMVAIATELEQVQLQLSRVIEQAGTLTKDRGDT
ncbi:uncharacterized protein LOC113128828 [Mastacembelus armatus]|uniref:uncharacterized protein LOC113128828 n=1 Tax=Mastacembelus armatus TaxID=205130 RepID=UPI000E458454|nr:uncharacterized protein LOC113128828 [Mastacembelus armatus]